MAYKHKGYVTVDVEVDISDIIDGIDDDVLLEEVKSRGYAVSTDATDILGNNEYDYLIQLLGNMPFAWDTNRIREKLLLLRYQE